MSRLRQVRLSYPAAFVELGIVLARMFDKREVSRTLGLPLSTLYRWVSESRGRAAASVEPREADALKTRIEELVAECEHFGFGVRQRVAQLAPSLCARPWRAAGGAAPPVQLPPLAMLGALERDPIVRDPPSPLRARNDGGERALEFASDGTPANLHSRVFLARVEIERRYFTRLSCATLARRVGMTRFNFIKVFKATFGVSPYRYLSQVRVEHARHMLTLTDQPLHVIAAGVGFGSVSSLSRAFKRFAGASPANLFGRIAPAADELHASAA